MIKLCTTNSMTKDNKINPRYISLFYAVTNCALGCAIGFYYGDVTFRTIVVAIAIIICGGGIQSLCNYSIDYSRAYRKHRLDKQKGFMTPIMIGEISLTQLRKRMALVTLLIAVFGALSIYLAIGSNIQLLSWFIFLCALSILLALFYTTSSIYLYKGIGAIAIFVIFGMISILGSQFIIVAASSATIDFYPDAYLLAISAAASSLIILYVRSIRTNVREKAKTIGQVISYEISTIYLIALVSVNIACSVLACITSHRSLESLFIIAGFIPMIYFVYTILRYKNKSNFLKNRFNELMLSCSFNNLIWIIVLVADFWIYY